METVFEPTPHAQKLLTNLEEVSKDSDALYRMTQVSCLKVGDEISYWLEDLDNTELNGLIVTGIEPVSKTTPNGERNGWAYMSDAMRVDLGKRAWNGEHSKSFTISADIIVAVKVV